MQPDYKRKKSCQRVRILTIGFKPFLSMKITLQHSFIVKHITHWFWYDNIYHLWNLYLQKKQKNKKQEIVNSKACKWVNCFLQSLIHFWQQSVHWFYLTLLGEIFILSLTGTYLFNFSRNHNHFVWQIIVFDQSLQTRFVKNSLLSWKSSHILRGSNYMYLIQLAINISLDSNDNNLNQGYSLKKQ